MPGAASAPGFIRGFAAADHDVVACPAGAVDDGDGLLLARRGVPGLGFGAVFGRGRGGGLFFLRRFRRTDRDAGDRLAAERIVVEDGEANEGNQEQAQQHREQLHSGKWQPIAASPARGRLPKRRAQIVGRLCHGPFPNQSGDDTTAGRGARQIRVHPEAAQGRLSGAFGRNIQQKGRPEGRPFRKSR